MFAFKNPELLKSKHDWIDWAVALKEDPVHRYGLEFIEDWNGARIMTMGALILVSITTMAGIWAGLGGNIQNTFAVASFALAVCTSESSRLSLYLRNGPDTFGSCRGVVGHLQPNRSVIQEP